MSDTAEDENTMTPVNGISQIPISEPTGAPTEKTVVLIFYGVLSSILSQVLTGHNMEILNAVTEFLSARYITNKDGLSLLSLTDVPSGPKTSVWLVPTFSRAFQILVKSSSTTEFARDTKFSDLRDSVATQK